MTMEIVLRYFHFVSIFAIVGSLVAEHLLLKKKLMRSEIARLSRIDAFMGWPHLPCRCWINAGWASMETFLLQ
jgi:uncharacterized membrane protein